MSTQSEPTLDQKRAKHAYDSLENFLNTPTPGRKHDQDKKKYGVHVRKLPVRIIASGLGQSLAFLHAKDYCPQLLITLADWVLFKRNKTPKQPGKALDANELILAILNGTSEDLQLYTAEVLAYLRWLTRFAEAKDLGASEED